MKKTLKILLISILITLSLTIFSFAYSTEVIETTAARSSSGICGGSAIKFFGMSSYNQTPCSHIQSLTCVRNSRLIKTSLPPARCLNSYVVTNVYKDNGSYLGVIYGIDEAAPTSKLTSSITASVSTSGIDVRSGNHYGYHQNLCDNGEHIYFYYND